VGKPRRDQLARDILDCSGDTLPNDETDFVHKRDSWVDSDQLIRYDPFECASENGTYYSLNALKWTPDRFWQSLLHSSSRILK